MTEIAYHALNYPGVLHVAPHDALRLGVAGQDRQANRARLAAAGRIVDEANTYSERAYASAHWMGEPDIPEPHIARALMTHGGDMVQAVQDPRVVEGVRDRLGYRPHWEYVYDHEDDGVPSGQRLINRLEFDDDALGEVRTAVNELRAGVGVSPVDELRLLAAAGVEVTGRREVSARAIASAGVAPPNTGRLPQSVQAAQSAERTLRALADAGRSLDAAAAFLQGAERGLARRQEDLAPAVAVGWSTNVRDSIVQLVNRHLETLQMASADLNRADVRLRDAYRDSMAMAQSARRAGERHGPATETLAGTIEVTVAVQKARPRVEAAIDQLSGDPSAMDRIIAAREQIGRALPHLDHARTLAASAAREPLNGRGIEQAGEMFDHRDQRSPQLAHEAGEVAQNAHRRLTGHRPDPTGEPAAGPRGHRR